MEGIRPEEDAMDALEEQVAEQTRLTVENQRYAEEEDDEEWNDPNIVDVDGGDAAIGGGGRKIEEEERRGGREEDSYERSNNEVYGSARSSPNSSPIPTNMNNNLNNRMAASSSGGGGMVDEECLWDSDEIGRGNIMRVDLPADVQDFLLNLYSQVYARNIDNIRKLYETDFHQITERHYERSRWPSCEEVKMYFEDIDRYHSLIMSLYSELYYRHAFSKFTDQITWEDRKKSWENYRNLMEYFLSDELSTEENNKSLRLPLVWVWDMLDEFVYQFQDTCRWRVKVLKKLNEANAGVSTAVDGNNGKKNTGGNSKNTDEENANNNENNMPVEDDQNSFLQAVRSDVEVWDTAQVLEFLLSLVERSGLQNTLKKNKDELNRSGALDVDLRYQLGYFGMIALLRVYVLMGDYYTGLLTVNHLDSSARTLSWKVPACHVTFCYYLGLAYMMLRRYNDAIRTISQVLIYVSKQRSYLPTQTYQHGATMRTVDKMYLIVLLCQALCNCKLDETISQTVKEKYSDKFYKLQQDSEITYREVFTACCPRFINPVTVSSMKYIEDNEYFNQAHNEPTNRQLNLFMKEALCLKEVSNVRSYAKLYNNIQLQKLGSLMSVKEKDVEDAVRSDMMLVKHKSRQEVWKNGPLLSSDFVYLCYEIDFYVDCDVVHIKGIKSQKLHVDYFIKQINKYQDLLANIQNTTPHRMGRVGGGGEGQREKNQYHHYNNQRGGDRGDRGEYHQYRAQAY